MSRISEIKKYLKKDMGATLASLLAEYDQDLKEAKNHLSMKGKTVEVANKEQAAWLAYYDERRVELEVIYDYVERWAEGKIRGTLFEQIQTNNPRDLSDRAINQIIDGRDTYIEAHEVVLEVKEMFEKFKSLVDAFKQRGFSLRNITELRVNRIHDEIL